LFLKDSLTNNKNTESEFTGLDRKDDSQIVKGSDQKDVPSRSNTLSKFIRFNYLNNILISI
jgi:hypothetical protein